MIMEKEAAVQVHGCVQLRMIKEADYMKNKLRRFVRKAAAVAVASTGAFIPMSGCIACNTVYATEQEEETGKVHLSVEYDADIAPSLGDVFVITYSSRDDLEHTASITIDASQYYEDGAELELPCGIYAVHNIEYQGEDKKIELQGYATNNEFTCMPERDNYFSLVIGDAAIDKMEQTYGVGGIKAKDGNHNEFGDAYRDHALEAEQYPVQPDGTSTPAPDDSTVSDSMGTDLDLTDPIQNPNGEQSTPEPDVRPNASGDAQIEDYTDDTKQDDKKKDRDREEEKKERREAALGKLVIILIVAVVGFGTILILHKKGKI